MLRVALVIAVSACGSPQQPAPSTPSGSAATNEPLPPMPPRPVVDKPALAQCEDPEHLKGAKNTYECAEEALKRKDVEVAAKLTQSIQERFPYSKYAVLSEELYADILFANDQFVEAAEAYDRFIKFHPTHDHVDTVRKKLADAQAKAKP